MLEHWNDLEMSIPVRETSEGLRLIASHNLNTGAMACPPMPYLGVATGDEFVEELVEPTGKVYAYTKIWTVEKPYVVGYVDLPNGLRVFGHVDFGEAPNEIGTTVTLRVASLPLTFVPTSKEQANG